MRIALVVLFLPFFLTLLYRFSFIHPISTLLLYDIVIKRSIERTWVPLEKNSPYLVSAVIVAEDARFCAHSGIDWDALYSVIGKGAIRGASTIPMQMAKNLFLWNGRSYVRKALEIPLALSINLFIPKQRQLEIYLNIVEWGPGIYGAEAASQHYFGHPAKTLNAREAATLAAVLPNPHMRNAKKPNNHMNKLIKLLQRRMASSSSYTKCAFK